MEEELKKALEGLKREAEKLSAAVDRVSQRIKDAEDSLQSLKINIPFTHSHFSWNKDWISKSKNFRLFFLKDGDEQPFIETDMETRCEYFDQLPQFINEYKKFLESRDK